MARRILLTTGGRADIGERLLSAKLQILNGTGNRRPAIALSVLTGRVADQADMPEPFHAERLEEPPVVVPVAVRPSRPQLHARTVYLTEAHLRDIETIIQAWQAGRTQSSSELFQTDHALERASHNDQSVRDGRPRVPRRLTRSAVLRRAIEYLRGAVEADPATSLLESE